MDHGTSVGFIGFGEAAQALVSGWAEEQRVETHGFDIKTDGPDRDAKLAEYAARGTAGHLSLAGMLGASGAVFSLVTADQAHLAARQAAAVGLDGQLFLDGNSCAPQTKVKSAEVIEAAGGRYVDIAIMAPVHPKRHKVPILVSGPHAAAAVDALQALGMNATEAAGPVGRASGIKLCRSIMIKGMEALNAEMLLTARSLGVEDAVWASLNASNPGSDWEATAAYALERMLVHGTRRAAEMDEAVVMVDALGLNAGMARSTVTWQRKLGASAIDPEGKTAAQIADALLSRHRG